MNQLLYLSLFEAIIILITLVFTLKVKFENKKLREENVNLDLHYKSLQEMYDGIRGFKHDFANFVQALDGYVKCDDMNGVKKMTSSIYDECKIICSLETLNFDTIENPAIYNLLLNKYNLAKSKNVIINFEIASSLKDIQIDIYKFTRVLGILLDNAIEASQKCDEKLINVRIIKDSKCTHIIIENTYKTDIDINKIYEKGYTTKNDNSSHGLGLWKVKQIVDSSSNLELNTSKGIMFRQELNVFNYNLSFSLHNGKILLKQK